MFRWILMLRKLFANWLRKLFANCTNFTPSSPLYVFRRSVVMDG